MIVDSLIAHYTDESLATSTIVVKMIDENGLDCGGVTSDMFTTFWNRAREQFFTGCDMIIPFLPAHKYCDDSKFRVLGRILSHTVAVTKEIPIPMCKSAFISMIYNITEVAPEVVLEDFMFFLDVHDRSLLQSALTDFDGLSDAQSDELRTIFERFDYGVLLQKDSFKYHLTLMARNVILIRPRPLLELMRSGLPEPHVTHFWSSFHLETLTVLFQALRPTPERIVKRIRTAKRHEDLTSSQKKVFKFLTDFLKELDMLELETFLHFVTGKKSTPREPITIEFTRARGGMRIPIAHTCSNMVELPETYHTYEDFKSEFKHVLASPEALTMTME